MHIKSIQLDGFKSYQKHTEIAPFSPQFNAITGYNGSGKSNVLDSICFLLGISKLDNIRAKSMNELISHGGSKAVVQIRFDNRDKKQSPFGMDHLDELVVQRHITALPTGKSCYTGYTLNGHSATTQRMIDFFRGVGLNVNNPHFLIMQGRITTVLNMKPEEILGMVEEAAGTKMYDQKRKEAEKTLFLKEAKLKEIDRIFEGSIDPRMEKFREDRKNMVEVTRLAKLKENSQRKLGAFEYHQSVELSKRDMEHMELVSNEVQELNQRIEQVVVEIGKKGDEQQNLIALRDNPAMETDLSLENKTKQEISLKLEQEKRGVEEGIVRLKSEIERTIRRIENDEKVLGSKQVELENIKNDKGEDIDSHEENKALITKLRGELEGMSRGTVTNDKGEHVSLETYIQETRAQAADLDTKVKTANNRRDRIQANLNRAMDKLASLASKSGTDQTALAELTKAVEKITQQVQSLGYNADEDVQRREREQEITDRIHQLKRVNDNILNNVCGGRYAMNFVDPPVPWFNYERDVEGLVLHLIRLKPQYKDYAMAVDVALSGAYTNVVVRNQDVARVLIESQCLPGRRTLIPISENHRNNRYTIINDQSLQRAQRVAEKYHENVVRLLDMIEYPECVGNTFKAMCGQIIVVDSLDCAREVAYTDGVKSRTLTKRGDDVRPTGVMSGGVSEHSKTPIINAVSGIHKQLDEIKALRVELTDIRKYISATESKHTKYKELNSKLQESERRLAVYQSNMKTSQAGMVQQDIDNLKNEIEPVDAEIADASLKLAALQKKITDLESKKHNDTQLREKRKAEICKQLKEIEARTAANNDNAAKARRAVLQIQAAVDELRNTINNEKTQCEKKQEELRELEESLPAAEAAYEAASKEHKEVSAKLHALKTEQRTIVDRLAKVAKDITMMRKEEAKLKSKIEDKEKEVVRLKESELAHKKFAASLLKKCEWLVDEQAHFNKKGGIYDFDGYTANKGNTEVKEYTEKIEKLERSLCMKNVSNLDTCEAKVMDIKNKRAKLTEDFNILKKTIAVLDRKKTDEIHRAHESVNADFGKIFHCLLPDASAELVPPEGKTVCDGLEVKVAFNGVVKDSLHELSGGQRSLVALSLILAMLKFKPAPLYILDEVDAALDLSHTANIGKMIKAHFRDSQFIIVSLKQGMFSNADALFQTHFADGHSSCTLMSGAELKKLQTDKKLAAQATEVAEAEKEATKKPSKKSAKKAVQNTDDEME